MSQKPLTKHRSFRRWLKRKVGSTPASLGEPIPKHEGVFGVPLNDSIRYAHSSLGYVDQQKTIQPHAGAIPIVIAKCGAFLKQNALHTPGIFRLSGNLGRIRLLQEAFDKFPYYGQDIDLSSEEYTVHDVGAVFRRYLQHLPDPVVPIALYQSFQDVHGETDEENVAAYQALIQQLPVPHQHLLLYLLDLIKLFASAHTETRMDVFNLTTVFCPIILSHPEKNTPEDYKISQRVLTFLVEYQALFIMHSLPDQQHLLDDEKNSLQASNINPSLVQMDGNPSKCSLNERRDSKLNVHKMEGDAEQQLAAPSPATWYARVSPRKIITDLSPGAFVMWCSGLGMLAFIFYQAYLLLFSIQTQSLVFLAGFSVYSALLALGIGPGHAISHNSDDMKALDKKTTGAVDLVTPGQDQTENIVQNHERLPADDSDGSKKLMDEREDEGFCLPAPRIESYAVAGTVTNDVSGDVSVSDRPLFNTDYNDASSIASISSRFREEELSISSSSEEILDYDDAELNALAERYEQIKADAQLAVRLQQDEQERDDTTNPFVSKEVWKIRRFK